MKTTIVRLTLLCGIASASSGALAQYYVSPVPRPTATYRSPGGAVPYVAQRTNTAPAARSTALPAPITVATQPIAAPIAVPTFKPINPPSRTVTQARQAPAARATTQSRSAQQAPLVANRPTAAPTPAPAQIRSASKAQVGPAATPSAAPMYAPSMSGMGWNAPMPSMPMDAGATGYGTAGAPAPAPVADPGIDYSYGGDGGYAGSCGDGACGQECGRCCGHCCCLGSRCCACCGGCCAFLHACCIPCKTTGDMVQHMPFFGTTHGYYYFRPYHVMHVFSQQELATRWGGDPRNPYDNTMFTRIYEQMGVEAKPFVKGAPGTTPIAVPTTVAPMTVGPNGTEYVAPGNVITPTPVPTYTDPSSSYVPPSSTPTTVNPTIVNPPAVTPLPGVETLTPPTR